MLIHGRRCARADRRAACCTPGSAEALDTACQPPPGMAFGLADWLGHLALLARDRARLPARLQPACNAPAYASLRGRPDEAPGRMALRSRDRMPPACAPPQAGRRPGQTSAAVSSGSSRPRGSSQPFFRRAAAGTHAGAGQRVGSSARRRGASASCQPGPRQPPRAQRQRPAQRRQLCQRQWQRQRQHRGSAAGIPAPAAPAVRQRAARGGGQQEASRWAAGGAQPAGTGWAGS